VSWYDQFKWLEYSIEHDAYFCYPCHIVRSATSFGVFKPEAAFNLLLLGLETGRRLKVYLAGIPRGVAMVGYGWEISLTIKIASCPTITNSMLTS